MKRRVKLLIGIIIILILISGLIQVNALWRKSKKQVELRFSWRGEDTSHNAAFTYIGLCYKII